MSTVGNTESGELVWWTCGCRRVAATPQQACGCRHHTEAVLHHCGPPVPVGTRRKTATAARDHAKRSIGSRRTPLSCSAAHGSRVCTQRRALYLYYRACLQRGWWRTAGRGSCPCPAMPRLLTQATAPVTFNATSQVTGVMGLLYSPPPSSGSTSNGWDAREFLLQPRLTQQTCPPEG